MCMNKLTDTYSNRLEFVLILCESMQSSSLRCSQIVLARLTVSAALGALLSTVPHGCFVHICNGKNRPSVWPLDNIQTQSNHFKACFFQNYPKASGVVLTLHSSCKRSGIGWVQVKAKVITVHFIINDISVQVIWPITWSSRSFSNSAQMRCFCRLR